MPTFRARTGLRPRRGNTVSHSDGARAAFIAYYQLGPRDVSNYVAQSQSSRDLCLRFRPYVTAPPARLDTSLSATTLAGRDSHPLVCINFPGAQYESVRLPTAHRVAPVVPCHAPPSMTSRRTPPDLLGSDVNHMNTICSRPPEEFAFLAYRKAEYCLRTHG